MIITTLEFYIGIQYGILLQQIELSYIPKSIWILTSQFITIVTTTPQQKCIAIEFVLYPTILLDINPN